MPCNSSTEPHCSGYNFIINISAKISHGKKSGAHLCCVLLSVSCHRCEAHCSNDNDCFNVLCEICCGPTCKLLAAAAQF